MQVAREPVALLDRAQLAAALVEARVLDGDGGVGGEHLDQALVLVAERVRALLVGQVEGADDAGARDDRHAEEGAHVRVRPRPPAAEARVARDVVRAVGLRGLEHRAEQAVRARQRAHRGDLLLRHAGGDELGEAALAVGDAERRVARAGELARGLDDALQDPLDGALGRDRQHGVAHGLERVRGPVGHRG